LIQGKSTGERPEDAVAVVTANEGTQIEIVAEGAVLLFDRAELLTLLATRSLTILRGNSTWPIRLPAAMAIYDFVCCKAVLYGGRQN